MSLRAAIQPRCHGWMDAQHDTREADVLVGVCSRLCHVRAPLAYPAGLSTLQSNHHPASAHAQVNRTEMPELQMPLHTLIELEPRPDGTMVERRYKINIDSTDESSVRTAQCRAWRCSLAGFIMQLLDCTWHAALFLSPSWLRFRPQMPCRRQIYAPPSMSLPFLHFRASERVTPPHIHR